jgi:hypothetical protein
MIYETTNNPLVTQIDAGVLCIVRMIEAATFPPAWKYTALDALHMQIPNWHPHGHAADVLQTIARAMDKY